MGRIFVAFFLGGGASLGRFLRGRRVEGFFDGGW